MASQEFPNLFGVTPSWADIETSFSVFGGSLLKTADYAEISCSESVEIGIQRGASGGRKLKRTTGQGDTEASITFYRPGLRSLYRALMAKAPKRNGQLQVGLVGFDVFTKHSVPGDSEIYVVNILGCRVQANEFSWAEGPDPDKVTVPINCMQVVQIIDGQEVVLL